MKAGRKANGNAVLWSLDDGLKEEIFIYSHTHTLRDTAAWCEKEHGVKTSATAISNWRGKYGTQRRYDAAQEHVEELKRLVKEKGDVESSKLDAVMSGVFMSVASSQGDAKTYVALARLMLESKKVDLESRRITLLEDKAKELDELKSEVSKKKGGKKLSDMNAAEREALITFVDAHLTGKA